MFFRTPFGHLKPAGCALVNNCVFKMYLNNNEKIKKKLNTNIKKSSFFLEFVWQKNAFLDSKRFPNQDTQEVECDDYCTLKNTLRAVQGRAHTQNA